MTVRKTTRLYTPQQYYELERAADYKSEYYRGEIFPMDGAAKPGGDWPANRLRGTMPRMALPKTTRRYTPAEYYELERAADYKSEYYKGEIFAMAGGTSKHSLIIANISGELRQRLKGKPCTAYESNLRLKVKVTGLRTYPDVSVYCAPLERDPEDNDEETYTNPTVLFEVLSPSTEGYDRGAKSGNYRLIETLKAYVLVSQDDVHVEIYERQPDGSWRFSEMSGISALLPVAPIDVVLPLAEIYDRVDFKPNDV